MVWSFHFEWCHMTFDSTKLISCSYISEISLAQLQEGWNMKKLLRQLLFVWGGWLLFLASNVQWKCVSSERNASSNPGHDDQLYCYQVYSNRVENYVSRKLINKFMLLFSLYRPFIVALHHIFHNFDLVTSQFSSIFRSRLFFTIPSSATLRNVYFRMF